MRLYLDTSVLGALADLEDPGRAATTRELLRGVAAGRHSTVISSAVQEEISLAPERVRNLILPEIRSLALDLVMDDDESAALFAEYARAKVVPVRFRADMRHVALAVCARVDALVSLSRGPMMLGYVSHYGLGLFAAESRLVAS